MVKLICFRSVILFCPASGVAALAGLTDTVTQYLRITPTTTPWIWRLSGST